MVNLIKSYPFLSSMLLAFFWSFWVVAGRRSAAPRDWLNLATVIFPAVIIIIPLLWNLNKLEKIPNTTALLWLTACAVTCTLAFLMMRVFITMSGTPISKYIPLAQVLTPILVCIFSVIILKEDITTRQIFGLLLGCVSIYLIKGA